MNGVIANRQLSFKNPSYSTSLFPYIGNDNGGFVVHINNIGDVLKIDTGSVASFYDNNYRIMKTPTGITITENSVIDSTSQPYNNSTQLGGLSRQGDHGNTIWTKAFRFASTTTTTLYQGASIKIFWDGVSKQIKFDILSGGWVDGWIDHITGTSGSQNSARNTYVNDIAASGSGLWVNGSFVISTFGLSNYATSVRMGLIREGLSLSMPAFWIDYTCGNTSALYLTMKFINGTNAG
tara:strand:+ start:96 stop:806 length:711 start_codon:yes stop_codon:yes gene_type:complete